MLQCNWYSREWMCCACTWISRGLFGVLPYILFMVYLLHKPFLTGEKIKQVNVLNYIHSTSNKIWKYFFLRFSSWKPCGCGWKFPVWNNWPKKSFSLHDSDCLTKVILKILNYDTWNPLTDSWPSQTDTWPCQSDTCSCKTDIWLCQNHTWSISAWKYVVSRRTSAQSASYFCRVRCLYSKPW